MAKPLTIQAEDDQRIEALKRRAPFSKKIDVVRAGLKLLEDHVAKQERIHRWRKATALVRASSKEVNQMFRKASRLKKI